MIDVVNNEGLNLYNIRSLVIGCKGVGKSSLLYHETFSNSNSVCTMSLVVDGKHVRLEMCDVGTSVNMDLKIQGVLMVFDVTQHASYSALADLIHAVKKGGRFNFGFLTIFHKASHSDLVIALCANKTDLPGNAWEVRREDYTRFADENGCCLFETSSITGMNVQDLFLNFSRHIMSKTPAVIPPECKYKLIKSYDADMLPEGFEYNAMKKSLENKSILSDDCFKAKVTEMEDISPLEEAIVVVFWFMLFSLMLYGPFVFIYLLIYSPKTALYVGAGLVLVSCFPTRYRKKVCYTYLVSIILKYFSHRGIWRTYMPENSPIIVVGPPHGVFPFGSLLACVSVPRTAGRYIRGIAATALLCVPFFGNILRAIGVIDASRESVRSYLRRGGSIGISSGGIAEIFETNASKGTECIILKSRGGICKLAIETGAYLIPSYVFGNNCCFSVWYDSFGILAYISRKLRVSICFFWGRWGLPIPYRVPILGVLGEPIQVQRNDNPTKEEVQALLDQLIEKTRELFDAHKAAYGYENVTLIIK